MRTTFNKNNETTQIIYAESFNRLLFQQNFSELTHFPCVLFVTSQPFYEMYYEKMTTLFEDQTQYHWFICPTPESINQFELYHRILTYMEEMKLAEGTLLFGAGDSFIYHLCGTLKVTSFYISNFFYVPTTMTGFTHSLTGEAALLSSSLAIYTKQFVLPERVVYDTMLNELEPIESWTEDFITLVKLGVTCKKELLTNLYQASKSKKHAFFAPFVETVIEILETTHFSSLTYGLLFSKSFYQLNESHYLSQNQKSDIGFLLHTLWGIKENQIDFEFRKFYLWFEQIVGRKLLLPNQMITYDLAKSISFEVNRHKNLECLVSIGQLEKKNSPSIESLYSVIEEYRNLNKNS